MHLAPPAPSTTPRRAVWTLALGLVALLMAGAQHAATARAAGAAWSTPATTLAGPQNIAYLSNLSSGADANGIVTIAWSQETTAGHDRVMVARYPATGAMTAITGPIDLTASFSSNPQAASPTVAVSPNGDAVVAWTQPASAGGYTTVWVSRFSVTGNAWTGPTELVGPANALSVGSSVPVVAAGPQGTFTVAWFAATGSHPNTTAAFVAARYDGGWSTPAAVSPVYPSDQENWSIEDTPGIAADGLGNVMLLWAAKRRATPDVSRILSVRYTPNGGWDANPTVVIANTDTGTDSVNLRKLSVQANASGAFVAAWKNTESGTVIQAARYAGPGWDSAQNLAGPTGGRSTPAIALDVTGTATVAWIEWSTDLVRSATSAGSTPASWESSVAAPTGGVAAGGDVRIGVSDAGDVTAVWEGEDTTTSQYKIQANHLPNGSNAWSQPATLQAGAYQNRNWYDVVQYPSLAVAPSGVATAVWEDIVNETPDDNVHPAEYRVMGARYETSSAPDPTPEPASGGASITTPNAATNAPAKQAAATPSAEVRIPALLASAGIPVSTGGYARLPLSCPSGLPAACDASGRLTVTLPGPRTTERSTLDRAPGRVRVLARFRGVEIASGRTRLHTVRLAPKTYFALRKAGVRRVPATLRIVNRTATGAPTISTQRVWLRIRLLGAEQVTG